VARKQAELAHKGGECAQTDIVGTNNRESGTKIGRSGTKTGGTGT